MKSFVRAFLLGLCLLALPLIVSAQTASTQAVDLGDGYTITIPANWQVTKQHDGAFTAVSLGLTATMITPTYLQTLGTDITPDASVTDALIALSAKIDNVTPRSSSVQTTTYDNRAAAVYTYLRSDNRDQMDVVLTLSDGKLGYLVFVGNLSQLLSLRSTIDAAIASFDVSSKGASSTGETSSTGQTQGGETTPGQGSSTSPITCTVSTLKARTVQLRVGPGTNRGAISFLPSHVEVTVTGRIALSDSSVWYQLDKAQAAPDGTAAAQLWVAATDVTANGDCDHIGSASAPPVIPSVAQPAPGSQGGGSAAPGALPQAGTWVMTLNPNSNASCQGGPNVPFQTSEIMPSLTLTFRLYIVNANTINYGESVFTRISGTNSFAGSLTLDEGNVQTRFDLISATSMSGQMVGNATIDGTPCSDTVTFITNHG